MSDGHNNNEERMLQPGDYSIDVDPFPEVVAMLVAPYLGCRSALALAATRKDILKGIELDLCDEEIDPIQIKAVANAGASVVAVSMPCPTGALDEVCQHLGKLRKLKCTGPVDLQALARLHAPLNEVDLGQAIACENNHSSKGDHFDVAPLASCSALRFLDLADTKVTDVSSLVHCKDLTRVRLTNTKVVDLGPLASGCGDKLEHLDVRNTCVADTSPLSQCKGLRSIDFQGSEVNEVEPLAVCEHLESLNLRDTRILNINGLGSLKKLQKLHLGRAPVTSMSCLSTCVSLREINLERTWVIDLDPLVSCPIESMDISSTRVFDLAPLRKITTLKSLVAGNCKIKDLSGLAACVQLEHLDLIGTTVENLTPLSKCLELESIYLDKTPVKNLAPLAVLGNLKTLSLITCQEVEDISALCKGPAGRSLEKVDLMETRVGKIEAIGNCQNLNWLTLSKCAVADISPLSTCHILKTLYLQSTFVTDASCLGELKNLETAYLSNSPISDIEWARGSNVQTLFLDSTRICDVSALYECTNLQLLNLSHTQVTDVQPFRTRPGLRLLGLSTMKKLSHEVWSPSKRSSSASRPASSVSSSTKSL